MTIRLTRYKQFEDFRRSAKAHFNHLASANTQHTKFAQFYGFIISDGGPGGIHADRVDVYYGKRPFAQTLVQRTDEIGNVLPRLSQQLLVEEGAWLSYQRLDNGRVVVTLSPASTSAMRPFERSILIGGLRDLRRLEPEDTLTTTHFAWLVSYMEVTSLDGEPNWLDRFRIWKLRMFRPVRIGLRYRTPVALTMVTKILKFSLTVGLSGFLLYLLQHWFGSTPPQR